MKMHSYGGNLLDLGALPWNLIVPHQNLTAETQDLG